MEFSRRGFLGAILLAAAAPAIVRASSLMPIYVPKIITPPYLRLWGDGLHDDQPAIQALIAGGLVADKMGQLISQRDGMIYLPVGTYALSDSVRFKKGGIPIQICDSKIMCMDKFPENKPLIYAEPESNYFVKGCEFSGFNRANGLEFQAKASSYVNQVNPPFIHKKKYQMVI